MSGNHPLANPYGSRIEDRASSADSIADILYGLVNSIPPPPGQASELQLALLRSDTADNFARIADHLNNEFSETGTGPSFKEHTDRISGETLQSDGERYPFTGVQGIARAYNGMRESMRNEGEPVEDNYSILFTSILRAGKDVMRDVESLVTSDTSISGITISEITPADIEGISADSFRVANGIIGLIEEDNGNFDEALNYVKAYGLGSMILGMNRDTYFGKRLLDESGIATEELRQELDDIV